MTTNAERAELRRQAHLATARDWERRSREEHPQTSQRCRHGMHFACTSRVMVDRRKLPCQCACHRSNPS